MVACHHIPRVSAVWGGLSGDIPCSLADGEAATSKSELIVSVTKGSLFSLTGNFPILIIRQGSL